MNDPRRPQVNPWVMILGGLAAVIVVIWILRVLLGWLWALLKMVLILAVVGAVVAAYLSARRPKR
ncbi:MAG: hypothetical protein AB7L13_00195 [Acidimicrobiia bacterium]